MPLSQISKIENISHLNELRVLNLARNLLTIVENLNGLDSLTELNLRHNQVSAIVRSKTLVFFSSFMLVLTKCTISVTCLNCISISDLWNSVFSHIVLHIVFCCDI